MEACSGDVIVGREYKEKVFRCSSVQVFKYNDAHLFAG
jgi:hypothetical protein